ncbi:MAG TPA: hypothetical protein DCR44_00360 [Acholeplasmatales bacterium]|nr:MAG: hypothetical protein A2Y16_04815 [Tenericutes bacterium GWF2_57_13]HAQ55854.1 hypothetical protein [Acholeplasmatales bacterium]
MAQALYVHIPFCDAICTYCDFPKMVAPAAFKTAYIDALKTEIVASRAELADVETIYIGGGTPSSLPHDLLSDLLDFLAAQVDVGRLREWTIEANPNDVTYDFARLIKAKGVTRLSIGVQSGRPELLKMMGRTHTKEDVERAVKAVHDAHFYNVNLDFIYAVPTETMADLEADLAFALALKPLHLSFYTLILEPRTMLFHDWREGRVTLLDEELEATMFETVNRVLPQAGYRRYEVSNFAITGFESKHNLHYWNAHDYLGVGMGAHSLFGSTRFHNHPSLSKYLASVKKTGTGGRLVDPCDPFREACVMGLRKVSGIDRADLWVRFHQDPLLRFPRLYDNERDGLLLIDDASIRLTDKGLILLNYVERSFAGG